MDSKRLQFLSFLACNTLNYAEVNLYYTFICMFLQEKSNSVTTQMTVHKQIKSKIVSEYDQEIPQSQTAHKPMAPR